MFIVADQIVYIKLLGTLLSSTPLPCFIIFRETFDLLPNLALSLIVRQPLATIL